MEATNYEKLYNIDLTPIYLEVNTKELKVKNWTNLSREQAKETFKNKDKFNITILTGEISNIIVLDVDINEKNGKKDESTDRFFKSILNKFPEIQNTVICQTGSKNLHYYFKYDKDLQSCNYRCKAGKFHFEILSNKRNAVCPDSSYLYGKRLKKYKWINSPFDCDILTIPVLLKELLLSIYNKKENKKIETVINNNMNFSLSQYPILKTKDTDTHTYYDFDKSNEGKCCIFCNRIHSSSNLYIEYSKVTGIYRLKCWSGHCKGKSKILHFDKIMEDKLNYILNTGITDRNVAELAYQLCKGKFIKCKKKWFNLNKYGKIEIDDTNTALWEFVSIVFKSFITEIKFDFKYEFDEINKKLNDDNFDNENDMFEANIVFEELEDKLKIMKGIIKALEGVTHKNKIVKELEYMLTNNKVGDKLDRNPFLLGFDNGIFDLKEKKFRKGTFEDMVSMSTGYDYSDEIDEKIEIVIREFYDDVFINKDIRDYFLTVLSFCLEGYNTENIVPIWDGYGSNGKSTIKNLILSTFGSYAGDMSNGYIADKMINNPKSADAEMIDSSTKRISFFTEPETINKDTLKNLSGMDGIPARALYSNDLIRVVPHFVPCILLNNSKNINIDDPTNGCKRRIRNIEFSTKFIETDDLTDEMREQGKRKINKELSQEFEKWRLSHFHILLDFYYNYKTNGLHTPEVIKKSSDRFLNEENPYKDWVEECIIKVDDKEQYITLTECIENYNGWLFDHSNDYMKKSNTSKKIMRVQIENLLDIKIPDRLKFKDNKFIRNGIRYYQFKQIELCNLNVSDDEENNEKKGWFY